MRKPSSAAVARAVEWEPWLIWTTDAEAPRRGFGDEAFQATLEHLRKRGDKSVRTQQPGVVAIVQVKL